MTECVTTTLLRHSRLHCRHTFATSRLNLARALHRRVTPDERGRREDREPAGSRGPLCANALETDAQRHTGQPGHPGLPCAVVLRLMSRSPRGAMHYCPRRLADG